MIISRGALRGAKHHTGTLDPGQDAKRGAGLSVPGGGGHLLASGSKPLRTRPLGVTRLPLGSKLLCQISSMKVIVYVPNAAIKETHWQVVFSKNPFLEFFLFY